MNHAEGILRKETVLRISATTAAVVGVAMVLASLLTACGGSGSASTPSTTSNPTATTAVQVNMGDSPSDWMLGFSMSVSSMTLTGSNGSATVVSASMPMEMMHLMGTMQPLAMVSAPQGSYTGATVTIGSATVTYMDPTTKTIAQQTIQGPMKASVTFPSAVTVNSTPMAMNFDLNLASSVTGTSGNFTMNPNFTMTFGQQGSGNAGDYVDGGINEMMGSVSSVSGNSFSMTSLQSAGTFNFATNSSTVFSGVTTSMGGMTSGMLVLVNATLQSDGSLMATEVRSMGASGGMMGGGVITSETPTTNPTSLTMVMQNGTGSGMMSSYLSEGATVNLSSSTTYEMNKDGIDMSGLRFTPAFDASHIYVGQSVMPVSSGGMMSGSGGMGGGMMGGMSLAGTITASEVVLMPQGITGTSSSALTSGAVTSFDIALPSGSAFNSLTGATSVTVYQQANTIMEGGSTIASHAAMHAYGLLFYDGSQWDMVALRIGSN